MVKGHTITKRISAASIALLCLLFASNLRFGRAMAASDHLVLTEVQTQSATSTTEEFIEVYNPTEHDVDLSNFELVYKSATGATSTTLALSPDVKTSALKARSFAVFARSGYGIGSDAVFTSGISESGGHILLKLSGIVVDTVGWGTASAPEQSAAVAAPKGSAITRKLDNNGYFQDTDNNSSDFVAAPPSPRGGGLVEKVIDVCPNIEGIQSTVPVGYILDSGGACMLAPVDVCVNIPDIQTVVPERYERDVSGNCQLVRECHVELSEISSQPNYNSQEYIEFFNNTTKQQWLKYCSVKINGGASRALDDVIVQPKEYYFMRFTNGTIRNAAGTVNFVDSNAVDTLYAYPDTDSNQTVNFQSGSISGNVSNSPTPGELNQDSLAEAPVDQAVAVSVVEPCPEGKYRNPATNRCKNFEITTAQLAPCDANEERNVLTNRCRKVASSMQLAVCKTGQVRSSETNRCKAIGSTAKTTACQPGQQRNPATNRCKKIPPGVTNTLTKTATSDPVLSNQMKLGTQAITMVAFGAAGYALYEYRVDVRNLYQLIKNRHKKKPPG